MRRASRSRDTESTNTGLEARLVEAVAKYGPKNISLLSRVTGAHPETVRYKVKRQFKKFGFKIHSEPDLAKIGLVRHVAELRLAQRYASSAEKVMAALNQAAYLTSYARVLPQGHYSCVFELPAGAGESHTGFLQHLQNEGILKSFSSSGAKASKHHSIDPRHFNFRSGRWQVDWSKLGTEKGRSLQTTEQVAPGRVDLYDLLLLQEFQKNAMQHVVKIAREFHSHQKTLEYHYRAHVQKGKLLKGYPVRWLPETPKSLASIPTQVHLTFRDLMQDYKEVQQAVSKLPYLWTEDLLEDDTYVASLNIPASDLVPALGFVNDSVSDLYGRVSVGFVRRGEEVNFTIPASLFKEGWYYDLESVKENFTGALKASR